MLPEKKYTLITNGTIYNEKIVNLINKYRIDFTISIDGPKDINDFNRVFSSGKGSHDIISRNIKQFQLSCNQPKSIEGAISNETLRRYKLKDIYSWFLDNYKIQILHFPHVSISGSYQERIDFKLLKDNYIELLDYLFEKFSDDNTSKVMINYELLSLISDLVYKNKQDYACPAGNSTIAFSHDGEIYPCFMFNKKSEFLLGDVFNFEREEYEFKRRTFVESIYKKNIFKENNTRWYMPAYFYCSAAVYESEKSFYPSEEEIDFFEAIFETILNKIIEIQNDSVKYNNFKNNLKYLNSTYRQLNNL